MLRFKLTGFHEIMLTAGPVLFLIDGLLIVFSVLALIVGDRRPITCRKAFSLGVIVALSFVAPIVAVFCLRAQSMNLLLSLLMALQPASLAAMSCYAYDRDNLLSWIVAVGCLTTGVAIVCLLIICR